jgi:hypothetical protein
MIDIVIKANFGILPWPYYSMYSSWFCAVHIIFSYENQNRPFGSKLIEFKDIVEYEWVIK